MTKRLAWFIIIVGAFAVIRATLHYANAQQSISAPPGAVAPQSDPVTSAVASQLGELSIRNIQCGQQVLTLNGAYMSLRKEFEDYKANHTATTAPQVPVK